MAGADGVAAHFLEDGKLAVEGGVVEGRAERAEVVVVAHALERDALAVEQEAVVGGELDLADAEDGFVAVHGLAVFSDCGDGDVEIRMFEVPELGM